MNERIKELAEQAGFKLIRENCYDIVSTMSVQEFAELLIRECLASIPSDGHRGDFGRAVEFCQQQIKQHFEVEE